MKIKIITASFAFEKGRIYEADKAKLGYFAKSGGIEKFINACDAVPVNADKSESDCECVKGAPDCDYCQNKPI